MNNKRGVVRMIYSKDIWHEEVCDCPCHEPDGVGMMHVMGCCNPPKTEEGIKALADYTEKAP
jgi:hypothetical protein